VVVYVLKNNVVSYEVWSECCDWYFQVAVGRKSFIAH